MKQKSMLKTDQQTVIETLQVFYAEYHIHPSMRVLIKLLAEKWPKDKANSTYLHTLFPEGPLKQASLLGGLPKPTKCL